MLEVVAPGDNDVLIPIVGFNHLLKLLGFAKRTNHLLFAILVPDDFFAASSHNAAGHALLIENAGISRSGFHIGLEAEKAATIRKGVRAMAAVNQSTVPWCTFLIRNVFGVAGAVNQPSGRFSIRYAWLSARWGSLPLEGGIEAAYRAEIGAAADPAAKRAEIEARLEKLRSPFRTAEAFWIEEMIDPRDTRKLLVEFAGLAEKLCQPGTASFVMRP